MEYKGRLKAFWKTIFILNIICLFIGILLSHSMARMVIIDFDMTNLYQWVILWILSTPIFLLLLSAYLSYRQAGGKSLFTNN